MWFVRVTPLALVPLLVGPAYGVDVTMCGEVVPAGEVGVLQADLTCGPAIMVEEGATLDLNGHMLNMSSGAVGVLCGGDCVVTSSVGTGTIVGPDPGGESCGQLCCGILGYRTTRASNLTISAFSSGILSRRLEAAHVSASNNLRGLEARSALLDNVTANDNSEVGVITEDSPSLIRMTDSTVSGNGGAGITIGGTRGGRLNAVGVTITNNGCVGVVARERKHVRLADSQVTGHAIDLETAKRPQVSDTACGTSSHLTGGGCAVNGPWGVCANDP